MARHKSVERPPIARSVQIEVDGTRYEGTYTVDGPVVSVESLLLGGGLAHVDDRSPEVIAKVLLLELVHSTRSSRGTGAFARRVEVRFATLVTNRFVRPFGQ